jgi:hypothetical protein
MIEIMPVSRVGEMNIGGECPGPLTGELAEEYKRLVADECGSA